MKIYEAIEHLTGNPRKSKKTLEVSTEILSDFAVWCEDQGHLDDYEEHYPNHDCRYDVEQAHAKFQVSQAPRTDGIYLLRDHTGYEKTVEASFDANGKLVRLVDKDGNNWINWANDVIWTEPRASHQ
ncbi:hypothetical protein C6503_19280 [Candidatus Poribacteria bacterium]|nr:MAG: hypothetical protein C6503_19280 [Candidatus Poribacteria bacterium]